MHKRKETISLVSVSTTIVACCIQPSLFRDLPGSHTCHIRSVPLLFNKRMWPHLQAILPKRGKENKCPT